jgi:hypothetical protein
MNKDNATASSYERINSNEIATMSPQTLHAEDWLAIQTVEASYLLTVQQPSLLDPYNFSDREPFISYCSKAKDQGILQFIAFLRQIKEFEDLNEDDRFTLIKYNLIPIGALHKCIIVNHETDPFWDVSNTDIKMCDQFLTFCDEENVLRDAVKDLCFSIIRASEEDFTLLHLLVIALLFSKGLSMIEDEPRLNDPLAIYRAQSHYTRLIWNYLVDKQGEQKTIRQFIQLLSLVFRIQSMTKYFRDFFSRAQFNLSNKADFFTPLMRTLLHIV